MNYFSDKELECSCGCGYSVRPEFKKLLNEIREAYGQPISLSSAARCKRHNQSIGGAKRSAHVDGVAADLVRTPELLKFIQDNLERFNIWMEHPSATKTWIHIDSRLRVGGRVFYP